MNNFQFKNPTKLIFGKGEIASLKNEICKNNKILITYGGGSIKRNGVYNQVIAALDGYDYIEFGGIEANPKYETLMEAVEVVKSQNITFILAVGGGSVIDGTKFIAMAANYTSTNDPWDFVVNVKNCTTTTPMPFAAVLTLPATGSEMNCGAVVSRLSTNEKFAFSIDTNFPQFSILDPQVCYSLPQKQRANGVIDTFCHTLEQYLTYPTDSRVQDRFSEGVLLTLKEIGKDIVYGDENYDVMANFMFSATMGLNGFLSMGVPEDWATHMIGHELTAFFGLDHGVTLAIVGPSLMRVMKEEKREKLIQYGERVWGINSGDSDVRVEATIKATENFYNSLGVKTHLSDYGIETEKIEEIVERFRSRGWNMGEKGAVTPEKVAEILKGAL
ncbi:MAG: iron-containing alcohol dehydrogenase [Rikenellaceae bacterium]